MIALSHLTWAVIETWLVVATAIALVTVILWPR